MPQNKTQNDSETSQAQATYTEVSPAEKQRLRREFLELQKLEREEATLQQQREENARMQEAKLRGIEEANKKVWNEQHSCLHIKEDGRPAIVGQRDSHNTAHLLCLWCRREFTGFSNGDPSDDIGLPPHLAARLDRNKIGGPVY